MLQSIQQRADYKKLEEIGNDIYEIGSTRPSAHAKTAGT